ncbi:MAG: 50S ribosomal protein L24 [Cellvibrionales bacterium]|nr:50S ribosomal protein L24 [Cellvibrionales bacterium]
MASKIRRDDEVIVIAGRDKGKRGTVQRVLANGRLLVSGVHRVKKHQKPNPQMQIPGGIIEKEAPIHVSNVAIWNATTSKPDRVGFKLIEGDAKAKKPTKKQRIYKSSGEPINP